jgi:outer membrane protein OmpA-like peptidoglycan-associated protein
MKVRLRSAHRVARAALLLVTAAVPVHAQRAPAAGGVEVRGGLVFPEHATTGVGVLLEGDMGYLWRPQLRLIAGLSRFAANIDREPGDNEGSFVATGFSFGARYDIVRWGAWAPYLRTSLTAQHVDADAWDHDVGRLLSGMHIGASLAAGGRYAVDANGRLSGTFEIRSTLLNNIAHTSVEIGVRALRRGSYAYVEDAAALRMAAPWRQTVVPPPAAPRAPTPDQRAPAAVTPDTAALRAQAQAAAAEAARRQRERDAEAARVAAAEQRREEAAAEAARVAASLAAERARAEEALLRQGLHRAAAVMTHVSSVRETADAFVISLGGGAFASGASTLTPAARAEVRILATVLAGYPGHVVSVEGHTDSQGDAAANQLLSVERAAAVRAALIVEGIDPLWSAVRGYGAARPVADNATPAGRALNRRVELHIARRACTAPPVLGPDTALRCPGN